MRQAQFIATDINASASLRRSLQRGKGILRKILTAVLASMREARQRQAIRIISGYECLTLSGGRGIGEDHKASPGARPDVDDWKLRRSLISAP
jgi:hypothetical protein